MNTPVNFELAKLLKEKGFDELCDKKYIVQCLWQNNKRDKYKNSDIHSKSNDVAAPTIADVIMWLHEKHGIWISVDFSIYENWFYSTKSNLIGKFNSPTEAYEAAIEHTLNNSI